MDGERTAEDPLITVLKLFHTKLWDNEMRLWGYHQYGSRTGGKHFCGAMGQSSESQPRLFNLYNIDRCIKYVYQQADNIF